MLPYHQKLGFEPNTHTDQGGVNALLLGIELATIDRRLVALAI